MTRDWRWDPCISHSGDEVVDFIGEYFADTNRNVVVIAGAGFDPRASVISRKLAGAGARLRGFFCRKIAPPHLLPSSQGQKRTLPICRQSSRTTSSFQSIFSAAILPSSAVATWRGSWRNRISNPSPTWSLTSARYLSGRAFRSSDFLLSTVSVERARPISIYSSPTILPLMGDQDDCQRFSRICAWLCWWPYAQQVRGSGQAVATSTCHRQTGGA